MALTLRSSAFGHNESIPERYTCDGADRSPPLEWQDVPAGTRSLVLVVDDPDAPDPAAPKMTFVHWVLYNLPPDIDALAEAADPHHLPSGTGHGRNDWDGTEYRGPCPPIGEHRYFHKLYALDVQLPDLGSPTPDLGSPTKAKLEQAMEGHILAQAELIGLYSRD